MIFIPYYLDVLGTTDILEKGTDNVVFRTCPEERNQVVFQMGTFDAMSALKAAEIVLGHLIQQLIVSVMINPAQVIDVLLMSMDHCIGKYSLL
ncbi:hypothetical protein P3L10_012959 [Capsicum annuum]